MNTQQQKADVSLYLVASMESRTQEEFLRVIHAALEGGVSVVQLREKRLDSRAYYELACRIKELCDRFSVPLCINDRADIALASGASGVHIGEKDLPLESIRAMIGADSLLGYSLRDKTRLAEAKDADYLGVGAVFATQTKTDSVVIGVKGLEEIVRESSVPVVAIGGINESNLAQIASVPKLAGIAVSSAIMHAKSPKHTAHKLRSMFDIYRI